MSKQPPDKPEGRKMTRKESARTAANARWSRRKMRVCPTCKGKGQVLNEPKEKAKATEAAA